MFSQSIKIARSSVITVINDSSHVVALVQRYRSLSKGLFVELGLYPQEPFLGLEVSLKIEGRHDGRRSLFAAQPDGVFGRLLKHFAILVGDQDPGLPLPLGHVLTPLELGVDDEVERFIVQIGSELIEHPDLRFITRTPRALRPWRETDSASMRIVVPKFETITSSCKSGLTTLTPAKRPLPSSVFMAIIPCPPRP